LKDAVFFLNKEAYFSSLKKACKLLFKLKYIEIILFL